MMKDRKRFQEVITELSCLIDEYKEKHEISHRGFSSEDIYYSVIDYMINGLIANFKESIEKIPMISKWFSHHRYSELSIFICARIKKYKYDKRCGKYWKYRDFSNGNVLYKFCKSYDKKTIRKHLAKCRRTSYTTGKKLLSGLKFRRCRVLVIEELTLTRAVKNVDEVFKGIIPDRRKKYKKDRLDLIMKKVTTNEIPVTC